jgi:hypothetical protein
MKTRLCRAFLAVLLAFPSLLAAEPARDPAGSVAAKVAANPKAAPRIVADAIETLADGCVQSPAIVAAAIKALPQPAPKRLVAEIVYRAVHECPDSVLGIVDAAVKAAPASAAAEIVAAAVSAVPDPYKPVAMPGKAVAQDYKSTGDAKSMRAAEPESAAGQEEVPLVDAIVKTAFAARDGLNLDALVAAADQAIKFGLDKALAAIDDPRILFGVGDAGLTNFENEPRTAVEAPGTASSTPTPSPKPTPIPTPTPTPPPVSK